jgi:branched-chain amino acid transport system permease protein
MSLTRTTPASFVRRHRTGLAIIGVSVFLSLVPPLLADPWRLGLLNLVAVNGVIALGLNLFIGYAGQISLGHAAFFGLGAYGSAILTTTGGMPPWAALPLVACGVALTAWIIGVPTLRLSGHYLAMATLGFNIVIHHALVQWDHVTGGPSGLTGIPSFAVAGVTLRGETSHYYLLWGVAMVALTLAVNFVRSGLGRGLAALAQDEIAAAAMGVDVRRGKIAVFTISAVFASVGGSLFAHYMGTLTPDTFGIFASIDLVIMVVIGGLGSLWGSLAGAAFVTVLPHVLGPLEDYKEILHGLIVVVVLLVLPRGLVVGLVDAVRTQLTLRNAASTTMKELSSGKI